MKIQKDLFSLDLIDTVDKKRADGQQYLTTKWKMVQVKCLKVEFKFVGVKFANQTLIFDNVGYKIFHLLN